MRGTFASAPKSAPSIFRFLNITQWNSIVFSNKSCPSIDIHERTYICDAANMISGSESEDYSESDSDDYEDSSSDADSVTSAG